MRRRRPDLRERVNGNLAFRFAHEGLTSHAGLEFLRRYLGVTGVGALVLGCVDGPAGAVGAARVQSHHRKVPSYYPITAYEAQSGQVLRVQNRPDNVHDGKGAAASCATSRRSSRRPWATGTSGNSAWMAPFFAARYSPSWSATAPSTRSRCPSIPSLGLKPRVQQMRRWGRVTATVSCAERALDVAPWDRRLRIVVYRTRVQHVTGEEFPTRSLRSRRRPLRVWRRHHQ